MSMAACICRVALVASMIGGTAFAQMFSAGVRGGGMWGPRAFDKFTIGPTVEFKPPIIPIRIVADALYKQVNVSHWEPAAGGLNPGQGTVVLPGTDILAPPPGQIVQSTSRAWDFPIMARVELPIPIARPFIGAGPTFRYIPFYSSDNWQKGVVAGAGIRFNIGFVKITPELRYSNFRASGPRGVDNQGEFLMGITF